MVESKKSQKAPDLVFGLAGPLGVSLESVSDSLVQALKAVQCFPVVIKITEENSYFPTSVVRKSDDYYSTMRFKMDHATALCQDYNDPSFHSRLAINAISLRRKQFHRNENNQFQGVAYIVRQLKRPDEVALLRSVYGSQFILISVHGTITERKRAIYASLKESLPPKTPESVLQQKLSELIEIDEDEGVGASGQQLREVFQLGDVFISAATRSSLDDEVGRFIRALFGDSSVSPTKDEFAMYSAKGASFRSCDLSRQVGAAIMTKRGDLITVGCNEAPKAFGGTYWSGDEPDFRDVRKGFDPNQHQTREVIRDIIQTLYMSGYLSRKAKKLGKPDEIVDRLTETSRKGDRIGGELANSYVRDITEYGRSVHAEMNAICDAARLGRSVSESILFCTTFPCHNCCKHIISVGIRRVVFIEPYPKSRAEVLFRDEITIGDQSEGKVAFEPFLGIAPSLYKILFQKGRRKDSNGRAKEWMESEPKPLIKVLFPAYLKLEIAAMKPIFEGRKSFSSTRSQIPRKTSVVKKRVTRRSSAGLTKARLI